MNVHRDQSADFVVIGDWTFSAADGSLTRGRDRRRLEKRAAEVLRLLARRRGGIVTQQELIDRVWAGRVVSPNSVAVTIADIRKALEDHARAPRFIETVPKRGYRLMPPATPTEAAAPTRRRLAYAMGVAAAGALALSATGLSPNLAPRQPAINVGGFANETGSKDLQSVAAAVRELAVTDLGGSDAVRLQANGRYLLTGRLIMWTGHPATGLTLVDTTTGTIAWTGMASGPEAAFPRQMEALMADLSQTIGSETAKRQ